MNTDKQPQTVYIRCKSEFSDASLILPFTHDKSILNGMPLPVQEIKNVYIFTPEELEALLQKERREAAEKAMSVGMNQAHYSFLHPEQFKPVPIDVFINNYLNQHYPLPQPPK